MSVRDVPGVFNIVSDLYSSILKIVIMTKGLVSSKLQLNFNWTSYVQLNLQKKKKKKKTTKNKKKMSLNA